MLSASARGPNKLEKLRRKKLVDFKNLSDVLQTTQSRLTAVVVCCFQKIRVCSYASIAASCRCFAGFSACCNHSPRFSTKGIEGYKIWLSPPFPIILVASLRQEMYFCRGLLEQPSFVLGGVVEKIVLFYVGHTLLGA